jgi:ergothioneine biosynthesis protein EgtB
MDQLKSVLAFSPAPADRTTRPLADQYSACRRQTEFLTASLSPEDQMVQSSADSSPAKWHQAHTSWFFETFILDAYLASYRSPDPRFRALFNSYYNSVSLQPSKALRSTFSRPSLGDVENYRRHVDNHMLELLQSPTVPEAVEELAELGINHEQQHQELLVTDIKHAFWSSPLRPIYQPTAAFPAKTAIVPQGFREYPDRLCHAGSDGPSFHFDNEAARHKVYVRAFRLASRLASCGDYLAFIEDGGYRRPEFWLSDGWKAVETHHWTAPLYWESSDSGWMQFTCSGMRKIEEAEPVCHVSFFEADAFARWSGARLPTEFEWEVAAREQTVQGNLLENNSFHPWPAPVAGQNGPVQMFGDVWEWTASAYLPYPGFKPATGALGEYNGKFMSNQMVLRGGSCATPASHIRATYRNFFPPEARWQFSGIRLANDAD